jgi:steroid delta-isomerase
MKYMRAFAVVLAAVFAAGIALGASKAPQPVLTEAASKIVVTEGDITDRPYRVLGDITVTVDKVGIVDVPPIREKVAIALKLKAIELGADAVVQVRYVEHGFGIIRGSLEGVGRAVVFGPPGTTMAAPPQPAQPGQPQVAAPAAPAIAPNMQRPTQAAMKKNLQSYIDAINGGNADAAIALYAADATLEDPLGSQVQQGRAAVEAFVHGVVARGTKYELAAPIRGTNTNAAAMAFKAHVGNVTVHIIEVFTFNPVGQITSMKAYYGSEDREGRN